MRTEANTEKERRVFKRSSHSHLRFSLLGPLIFILVQTTTLTETSLIELEAGTELGRRRQRKTSQPDRGWFQQLDPAISSFFYGGTESACTMDQTLLVCSQGLRSLYERETASMKRWGWGYMALAK
jgi:hypothetical protein